MSALLLPIQALLARCSAATGINFTLISPDTIELSVDDAFKVAALVDLASRCAEVMGCFPDTLRETVSLGSEVFPAEPKPTSVGVQPDFTGRAALDMEAHKFAEAGRKSWVTRRANAAKKGGRK